MNIWDERPDPSYGTGAIVNVGKVDPMPKSAGKWNVYEITAKGSTFTVTLNGQKTVDGAQDAKFATGKIALQHGLGLKDDKGVEKDGGIGEISQGRNQAAVNDASRLSRNCSVASLRTSTGQAGIMTEDAANTATEADSAKAEPPADAIPAKAELPAPAFDMPLLRIDGVAKRFGAVRAVDRLSLDIGRGEFFALLGPSGCGKTTLLRMLAGFETPDEGAILLGGNDIAQVLPHQRPVNMMFQNYALFPHLSVRDNIAFGLKRARMPRAEIATRVAEMVALVRLEGLEKRKPDQLSGGQRQRVALARSLARRPQILLLDEPLAALDKKLRESTQVELMELQRRLGMTFIIVTHDQEEAMTMADRIGVMDQGRLEQVATPRKLYEAPNSRWVAEFVGDINMLAGRGRAERGRAACDCDKGRRHHRRRGAARTGQEGAGLCRDPAREGKAVAARSGLGYGQYACDQPARRHRHRCQLSRRFYDLQGQARQRCGAEILDGQYGPARR